MSNPTTRNATRKLRLKPLLPTDLPSHPALAALQTSKSTPVDLRTFVREVLDEAVNFSDSVVPSNFQKKGSSRSSSPSTAKVKVLSSDLMRGESWFARQSVHENAPVDGSASFDEFEAGLFDHHSVNEMEYTPSVYDAHHVLDWTEQMKEIQDDFGVVYEEVVMEIVEMCHNIPTPLSNRVFPTLSIRAFTRPGSFVVAQVPVDLKKVPAAIYTNGQNRSQSGDAKKREKVVVGRYTSVERVYEQDDGKIMWEMATASDARGFVPMAMQKLGVPGAIVKDVGFFMKWTADRRRAEAVGPGRVASIEQSSLTNGVHEETQANSGGQEEAVGAPTAH